MITFVINSWISENDPNEFDWMTDFVLFNFVLHPQQSCNLVRESHGMLQFEAY